MSKSVLDVTTLQFDDLGDSILLQSSLNTLDFEGTAGSDVALRKIKGITSTNDLLIDTNSNTTLTGTLSTGTVFSVENTIGNVTYSSSDVYNGTIERDPNGSNREDTLPTAVSLISLINDAVDGSSFNFRLSNTASVYEYIKILPGVGVSIVGRDVVSQGEVANFKVVVTSVAGNTITFYNVGSSSKGIDGGTPYMCTVIGTINNAPQSNNRYCQWGLNVGSQGSRVNNVILGFSGIIRSISVRYLSANPITIPIGNSLSFDIGECPGGNPNANNFTAFGGGAGIITWTNAQSGTFPSGFVNNVNFEINENTQLAFRSVRSSILVTPNAADVNVCLLITLF